MPYKYNQSTHSLEEMPEMKEPDNSTGWSEDSNGMRYKDEYHRLLDKEVEERYQKHIASLKTYPVAGEVKWVDGQILEEGKDFELMDSNKWFWCKCECGWQGSSENAEGGGQIADTGDYSDAQCPKCYNLDLDTDSIESYNGIVAIPIEENKKVEEEKESQDELWKEIEAINNNGTLFPSDRMAKYKELFIISKINQNK